MIFCSRRLSTSLRFNRRVHARRLPGWRAGWLRRAVAVLLAIAFVGFSAETLIADVHDGDASAAELAAYADAPASGTVPDSSPAQDEHAVHVCHCVHAHGGVSDQRVALVPIHVGASLVVGASVRTPPSVTLELHLRPPVA